MVSKIEVELEGLDDFDRNLRGSEEIVNSNVLTALREVGRIFVPALQRNTPKKTGALRLSTRYQILGGAAKDMALTVRQGAKSASGDFYGHYVRGGTRAHTIVPKKAKSLAFMMGDRLVFAQKVHHPGTKANPYHTRTIRQLKPQIQEVFNAAGRKIAAALADVRS